MKFKTDKSAGGVQGAIAIQGNCIDRADHAGCNGAGFNTEDVMYTLNTIDRPAVYDARGNGDGETVPTITGDHQNRITDYTAICCHEEIENPIRRLTPLEAERCQGLPDGWSDIGEWTDSKGKKRKTTDSMRYELIGNGIALPFWHWLLKRIDEHCTEHTMGSLFNGGGSFPLIWQSINGEGSCRWVSEIADFPIAVTKKHFGDEDTGEKGDWIEFFNGRQS